MIPLPEASAVVFPVPSSNPYAADKLVTVGAVRVRDAVAELPFNAAVMVTDWVLVTEPAVTVKLAVEAPAATVADAGVVMAELLSDSVTTEPPVGAAADNVTVHVELAPAATLVGEHASLVSVTAGAVTVTAAVAELPFKAAVMVTDWVLVTEPAVTVKLAVEAPAATVADAGVVMAELLSDSVTTEPPVGAAADNVTVHVELAPAATLVGEQASLVSVTAGAVTVTAAVVELPFKAAVMVTDWVLVTEPAVTVKLAVEAPAATVADAGVVMAELLSDSVTTEPPLGAAADNVTVHVELAPAATLVGEQASLVSVTAGAVTVTAAVVELPFKAAVMVTDWVLVTEPAVTVKLAVEAPAATVADAGVVMAELLSDSVTTEPPLGAAADNVTVHVELAPAATLVGEHASLVSVTAGAVTVTAAVVELPFKAAVMVTDWVLVTEPAVTVKLAVEAPAATVADAGVVMAELLSDSVTTEPPLGAAADNVTVHVELAPAATLVGLHCREETVGGVATTVPTAVFISA